MTNRWTSDRWLATLSIVFSIIYMIASWRLPRFTMTTAIDSWVFPMFVGAVEMILSIWLWIIAVGDGSVKKSPWSNLELKGGLAMIILAIAYIILLEPLGFVISSTLFLALSPYFLGWKRWGMSISIAVIFSIGMYMVFKTLMVPLPQGILPF